MLIDASIATFLPKSVLISWSCERRGWSERNRRNQLAVNSRTFMDAGAFSTSRAVNPLIPMLKFWSSEDLADDER